MTELHEVSGSDALDGLLPVGMLTQGGAVATAMAAIARRRRAQPGWEAFHYEKISDSEFEVTGGVASVTGGVKKWAGPHDAVIVSVTEILREIQAMPDAGSASAAPPATQIGAVVASNCAQVPAKYLQLRLRLPEDEAGRRQVLQAFRLEASFFGATVQSCALQD
ncbi:MAG: hypothetical protein HYZ65_01515 [Burkholderiales bacterium]|nr:hypothetical protein [Burkholderiales bacterium]